MRKAKLGSLVAAGLACALGASTVASASDVEGRVVCTGTTDGVEDLVVSLTYQGWRYWDHTDANGVFNIHVNPWDVSYALNFNLGTILQEPAPDLPQGDFYIGLGLNPTPFLLDANSALAGVQPFEIDAPGCAVPVCPALAGLTEGSFCPDRPLGNPQAECGYFGLVVLDKNDNVSGPSTTAEYGSDLAIVKAGGCYAYYVGVAAGDTLSSPNSSSISHVTYCTCPPQ